MRNPQIQEVLSAMGIQMNELANRLGWSCESIVDYATTPKDVPEDVVNKIATTLNVDPSVFFNDGYKSLVK